MGNVKCVLTCHFIYYLTSDSMYCEAKRPVTLLAKLHIYEHACGWYAKHTEIANTNTPNTNTSNEQPVHS